MFLSISVPLQLINLESFCFKTFYSVIKSVHKLEVRTYISFGSSFDKNHYDTNRTWQYRIWLSTVKLWFLHGRAELDFEDFLVCIDSVPFWKISSLSVFGWQVSFHSAWNWSLILWDAASEVLRGEQIFFFPLLFNNLKSLFPSFPLFLCKML